MRGAWPEGVPPRAAFTFSIFPYGSTNFVITDVIEGSHEAIVGPGQHQLLFANVDGPEGALHRQPRRGPAGPAEAGARAEGAGHGRGRAALLPDPGARCGATRAGVQLSNMGTPPWRPGHAYAASERGDQRRRARRRRRRSGRGRLPQPRRPRCGARADGGQGRRGQGGRAAGARPDPGGHRPRRGRGTLQHRQRATAARARRSRSA